MSDFIYVPAQDGKLGKFVNLDLVQRVDCGEGKQLNDGKRVLTVGLYNAEGRLVGAFAEQQAELVINALARRANVTVEMGVQDGA